MQEHYGLTDQQFASLQSQGITIADMFHSVKDFNAPSAAVSMVSLMYYVDTHGDFTDTDTHKSKTDILARVVFDNLEIKQKLAVGEYISLIEDGED